MFLEEMESMKQPAGTGGVDDDRKRKRMISNRESARRSRMKKQKRVDGLVTQMTQLQTENKVTGDKINRVSNVYFELESQNNVLRAQIAELTDRLRSLNSVLEIAQEVSGQAMDIPEIPDALLEPWQLPCPLQQPVGASFSNMFQF